MYTQFDDFGDMSMEDILNQEVGDDMLEEDKGKEVRMSSEDDGPHYDGYRPKSPYEAMEEEIDAEIERIAEEEALWQDIGDEVGEEVLYV